MIWLIGVGTLYLGIGIFFLIVFIKNRVTGYTVWNVLAVLFGWLPVGLYLLIKSELGR